MPSGILGVEMRGLHSGSNYSGKAEGIQCLYPSISRITADERLQMTCRVFGDVQNLSCRALQCQNDVTLPTNSASRSVDVEALVLLLSKVFVKPKVIDSMQSFNSQ